MAALLLPVVSEVVDPRHLERMAGVVAAVPVLKVETHVTVAQVTA